LHSNRDRATPSYHAWADVPDSPSIQAVKDRWKLKQRQRWWDFIPLLVSGRCVTSRSPFDSVLDSPCLSPVRIVHVAGAHTRRRMRNTSNREGRHAFSPWSCELFANANIEASDLFRPTTCV